MIVKPPVALPSKYDPNLELVGRGGFGVVFRTRDLERGVDVAVKVPHREDTDLAREVATEVQATARLRHPGIIQVLDAGADREGQPFLVMEYAGAGDLSDWVDREPPAWDRLLPLLDTVLAGLGHAHAWGLIHRDIKGENILLAHGPDGGLQPKLADFGLAKVEQRRGGFQETRLEAGTILYMAPEQFQGDLAGIHAGADLYAFGVLLYQLVSGKPPWGGDGNSLLDKLTRPHAPLVPRSGYVVPSGIGRLVDRLLARRPADRYGLAADVRRDLAQLGTSARVASTASRASVGGFVSEILGGIDGRPLPPKAPSEPAAGERAPAAALAGLRLPRLVDRDEERSSLWSAALRAADSPVGLVLEGPPGAGRSRLCRWLASTLEQGGFARTLHVRRGTGESVSEALAQGVRRFMALGSLRGPSLRERAEDWLRSRGLGSESERDALLGWLDPWDGASQFPSELRSGSSLAERTALVMRLLRAEARRGLCVVWLEDSGRQPALAALVASVLREAKADPFALLVLYEPPGGAPLASLPDFDRLPVEVLPSSDLRRLLDDLVPSSFPVEALVERARGNPLAAVEGARLEAAAGTFSGPDVRALPQDQFAETMVLRGVLSATVSLGRIADARVGVFLGAGETRGPRERALVLMSLLPPPCVPALLAAAFGPPERSPVLFAVVDEARSAGLVRAQPEGGLEFTAPVLAEAVDELRSRRSDLPELEIACAEVLLDPSHAGGAAARGQAAELLLSAGERERALALLLEAGEAHLNHDLERGRDLLGLAVQAALDLGLAGSDRRLVDAVVGAARAARNAGDLDDAEATLASVQVDGLPPGSRGWLLETRASVALLRGRPAEAVEEARAAAAAFEESQDALGLARASQSVAEGLLRQGQIVESGSAFAEAIRLAGAAESPRDVLESTWRRGRVMRMAGDRGAAARDLTAARTLAEGSGDLRVEGIVRRELGNLALASGDHERAEPHYRAAVEILERAGYRTETAATRNSLGELARARGQLAEARKEYAAALGVAKAYGVTSLRAPALLNLAFTELAMGKVAKVGRRVADLDALFAGVTSVRYVHYLEAVRAAVLAATGDWEAAEVTLDVLGELVLPPDNDLIWVLEWLGDRGAAAEQTTLAMDAYDLAHDLAVQGTDAGIAGRLAEKLARL